MESSRENGNNQLYIASMFMRGKWAERPENSIVVNVTSMQKKESMFRIDFSPMTLTPYKGYACFENYWQSGKVYEGIDPMLSKEWWRKQDKPKRRYPPGKGLKVLHGIYEDGIVRDYIDARKNIYLPEYYNLVKNKASVLNCLDKLESGKSLTIYDFDGPKTQDGDVTCLPLNKDLIREKLNDTEYPFGHGYIIGAILLGLTLDELINF